MNEILMKALKTLSNKMQDSKDSNYITVMEASCEIEDLQAKYDMVASNYAHLIREYRELAQRLIDAGNAKLIHPDWDDPNWEVGYITGVSDMLAIVKETENELH